MPIQTASQIIAVRAPQWSGDPREADLIELAKLYNAEQPYGTHWQLALALQVLHWYALDERAGGNPGSGGGTSGGSGVAGSVKSEKEGDLARSYGMSESVSKGDADLSQTSYGLELLRLRGALFFKPRTRMYDPDAG